jgi:ABC-type multidrug transport system ATPase subunit
MYFNVNVKKIHQFYLMFKDSERRSPALWRKQVAFVEQDDALYSNLTVHETLHFASKMRLPSYIDQETKITRVEDILKRLRLTKATDTKIGGGEMRGVSGGERKRVAIGQELVARPEILFLDEPTSGMILNLLNVACVEAHQYLIPSPLLCNLVGRS